MGLNEIRVDKNELIKVLKGNRSVAVEAPERPKRHILGAECAQWPQHPRS